jgi:hypothetical protein
VEHPVSGAVNVGDPRHLTFGGLAALVGERLGWTWEPELVGGDRAEHPWAVRHPVMADTTRLETELGVDAPEPVAATAETVDWLWERREELERLSRSTV